MNESSHAARALDWLRAQELPHGGIRVQAGDARVYPEITGYAIPTLLAYGERVYAARCVECLVSIQDASGSFADPDLGRPHVFDTMQVLRGLLAGMHLHPGAEEAAHRAAEWLCGQACDAGFGDRYDGQIPGSVHLYGLAALRAASDALKKPEFARVADRVGRYYASSAGLLAPVTLSHFWAYELDGLLELGLAELAGFREARLVAMQRPDGAFPAREGANWVCTPGVAQLSIALDRLGLHAQAAKALDWMQAHQQPSGGWLGSVGPGEYFPQAEIPWAAKFFLDAHLRRVRARMDALEQDFPDNIRDDDGRLQLLREHARPGDRVLEAGCGKGRFLKALVAKPGVQATGVDISARLLRHAGPACETHVGTLENLPLPDNSVDLAFSVEAIEHSANQAAAVAELVRVTRPGGTVIVIDKPASARGRLPTEPWERWPDSDEVLRLLLRGCVSARAVPVGANGNPPDGLLVAWVATKAMPRPVARDAQLLVVTEELPAELPTKGFQPSDLRPYYNPGHMFRRVAAIDWGRAGGWPDGPFEDMRLPPDADFAAWLAAVQSSADALSESGFTTGWRGLPPEWLHRLQEFAPSCIRGYGGVWSGWLALQIARQLGVPALVSVHNTVGISPVVMKRAGCVMAVSEAVASQCIKLGADPARVVTVPNRVDRERFSPDGPVAQGPEGQPRILCVARDVPQKGLERLLRACKSLLPRFPGLKLVHIGSSDRDWSRWPFATHLSSQSNDKLAPWYRWADVLALPSLHEGFGIVLIEAMACGTPCVTSNREPMAGIVTDRWDGLLCDPENEADIARALAEIADPSLRARLAAPARAATEAYDITRVAAREAALYRWLIQPEFPLLSVVLPTYQRAARIEAAIRNVLAQDYPRLELIVVDDGSTDGTADKLHEIESRLADPRLKVLRRENGGVARALNTGFEHAQGELLTWTSDDNAFLPGALSAMARELALDPELDFVFADYDLVRDDGSREVIRTGPVHDLAERNTVGACFLYRRALAEKVGSYDPGRNLAEDWDWWRRARLHGNMARLARVLYAYGDTPDSLTRQQAAAVQHASMELTGIGRDPARRHEYRRQLALLAAAYKAGGQPWRSMGVAWQLLRQRPWGGAGWWALTRALLPMPLLKVTRRMRGLNG